MKKFVLVLALLVSLLVPASALALSNVPDSTWMTNGRVRAITRIGDTIYIGGKFSRLVSRSGAVLSRKNLAAINTNTGKPTGWHPIADDQVFALAADGDRVLVGGDFTHINGVGRSRLAAVSSSTGGVLRFHAGVDRRVYSIRAVGNTIYVAGSFTSIRGAARRHIAAVAGGGKPLSWHAGTDKRVRELEVSGSSLYLVGDFSSVRRATRNLVARVSLATGRVSSWTPAVRVFTNCSATRCQWGDEVEAVNGHVFVGFSGPENRAESYDPVTGERQWRLWTSGDVKSMAIWSGHLIIGGHFRRMHFEGSSRFYFLKFLAKLNYNGVPDENWHVTLDETEHEWDGMYALQRDGDGPGSHLWVGGAFRQLSGVDQNWLARFTQ